MNVDIDRPIKPDRTLGTSIATATQVNEAIARP